MRVLLGLGAMCHCKTCMLCMQLSTPDLLWHMDVVNTGILVAEALASQHV